MPEVDMGTNRVTSSQLPVPCRHKNFVLIGRPVLVSWFPSSLGRSYCCTVFMHVRH